MGWTRPSCQAWAPGAWAGLAWRLWGGRGRAARHGRQAHGPAWHGAYGVDEAELSGMGARRMGRPGMAPMGWTRPSCQAWAPGAWAGLAWRLWGGRGRA